MKRIRLKKNGNSTKGESRLKSGSSERVRLTEAGSENIQNGRTAGRSRGRKDTAKHTDKLRLAVWARMYTKDALDTLVAVCKNEDANDSARISAANAILDRGYGKAPQAHDHRTPDGPMMMKLDSQILATLPDEMLDVLHVLVSAISKGEFDKLQTRGNNTDANRYEATLH